MPVKRLLCAVVVTAGLVCATTFKPGFNLFSKQQDIQLGQETSQEVLKQYQVVQSPFLQNYFKTIGQRLAATQEARNSGFPFTFTVLNDPSVNAFALPGGPMFVFTGLLKDVDNEAQLAGVMAHEMSHVILRHGTNQASKANLLQIPAILAGVAVGNGSIMGQLAQAGIGFGFNSVLLRFSRTDETQADLLGSHLMAEAGYNPLEMARFFEKLNGEGGARGPQFLSDHPNPGNREKAIEAEIRTLPQRNYDYQTGDFDRMKKEVAGVPAPAKRGNLRGSAAPPSGQPSGGTRQYQGQYFSVTYPDNWQAFGDNNSPSITVAPREGLVQGSNGATQVGYGAILSYFNPETVRASLKDATNELIHHLRANNPSLQVAGGQRKTRIGGYDGLVTMLSSSSPYGGDETDGLITVARPEGLFYMVFIAPGKDFRSLESTFNSMANSIRFNS